MAIITPAQTLCLGRAPGEAAAREALEPCSPAATLIDRDCHCRNPPVASLTQLARQTYDKHTEALQRSAES